MVGLAGTMAYAKKPADTTTEKAAAKRRLAVSEFNMVRVSIFVIGLSLDQAKVGVAGTIA